jgi:hypothetical protein
MSGAGAPSPAVDAQRRSLQMPGMGPAAPSFASPNSASGPPQPTATPAAFIGAPSFPTFDSNLLDGNEALWVEVGLEHEGVYNYDPGSVDLDRAELQALHDEFLAHRKLFGFQQDNVRNQMEHACFLIQNARDRYGPTAYQYLHNRSARTLAIASATRRPSTTSCSLITCLRVVVAAVRISCRFFSNYRRWCAHINAQRWCFQKRIKHAFDSPSYGDRNKIQDLVLWLLIWGEAANLRHWSVVSFDVGAAI